MTLLVGTSDNATVVAAPLRCDAVPAQRPASDSGTPGLLAATAAARQALSGNVPEDRDAVVWLSEHITTVDRVVYPAARRHLRQTPEPREQQAATHRLAVLVRRLHAQLAGDGAAALEDLPTLRRGLLDALGEHSAGERDLLAWLRRQLTESQWMELAVQYDQRLQRGPTRPHPYTPRGGPAGRLAYRLSSRVDHLLDVLDSRAVRPIPTTSDVHAT